MASTHLIDTQYNNFLWEKNYEGYIDLVLLKKHYGALPRCFRAMAEDDKFNKKRLTVLANGAMLEMVMRHKLMPAIKILDILAEYDYFDYNTKCITRNIYKKSENKNRLDIIYSLLDAIHDNPVLLNSIECRYIFKIIAAPSPISVVLDRQEKAMRINSGAYRNMPVEKFSSILSKCPESKDSFNFAGQRSIPAGTAKKIQDELDLISMDYFNKPVIQFDLNS